MALLAASKSSDVAREPAQRRRKKRRPKQSAAETFEASPQTSQADEPEERWPEAGNSGDTVTQEHADSRPDLDSKTQKHNEQSQDADAAQQQQQKQAKPEEYEVPGDYLQNIAVDRLNSLSRVMWEDQLRKGLQERKVVYRGHRVSHAGCKGDCKQKVWSILPSSYAQHCCTPA